MSGGESRSFGDQFGDQFGDGFGDQFGDQAKLISLRINGLLVLPV
jgi:hypothetical protein